MQNLRLLSHSKNGCTSLALRFFLLPAGPEDFLVLWRPARGVWSCLPRPLLEGVVGAAVREFEGRGVLNTWLKSSCAPEASPSELSVPDASTAETSVES